MIPAFPRCGLWLCIVSTLLVTGCQRITRVVLGRHAEREAVTPTNANPHFTPANMSKTLRLPLKRPVAITAANGRIWIADEESQSLAGFDPASGELLSRMALDDKPAAVSAAAGFVAVSMASGTLLACDPAPGKELWHGAASSGDVQLKPARDQVWAWDRRSSTLMAFDLSGVVSRLDARGFTAFAPSRDGVYWLSEGGIIGFRPRGGGDGFTAQLPSGAGPVGAMVVCANALWLSVPGGLLLLDMRSLELRARLEAPEGPVAHLLCENGRLFGGSRGAFVFDPAADAKVRALPIASQSPLRGLAVAANKLWALESAEPVAHIVDVP